MARSTQELQEILTDARGDWDAMGHPEYYDGCIAALEWVMGERQRGPLRRDENVVADKGAMEDELRMAIDILHGVAAMPGRMTRAYASGVECTLAWVLGAESSPPL